MTKVWKVSRPSPHNASVEEKGWAFANTEADALRLVGHADAIALLQKGKVWPGKDLEMVIWPNSGTATTPEDI